MVSAQEKYDKLWKKVCEQMDEKNGVCQLYSFYKARKTGKMFKITWTTTIEAVSDFITEIVHGDRYIDLVILKDPTITRQTKRNAYEKSIKDFMIGFDHSMNENPLLYHLAKSYFRYDNVEMK